MSLAKTRRLAMPVAVLTMIAFAATLLPPSRALAQSDPPPPVPTDPIADGTGGPSTLTLPTLPAQTPEGQTTVSLTTGAAQSRLPFRLPKARGDAQPSLALTYDSSVGVGFAGSGWTLSLPSIARRGAAGLPRFTDDVFTATPASLSDPAATFDEYLADGQLLVPICEVGACAGAQPGEILPASLAGASLSGWMYFRREVDDGARYFFSPDGQTWLKQEKSGHVTQFGHPLDAAQVDPSLSDGIERPAPWTNLPSSVALATAVYRWDIVREADASGNTVYYAWTNNASLAPGGALPDIQYISDVYDTLAVGQSPSPAAFAHHVHLTWQLPFPLAPVWTPGSALPDTSDPGVFVTPLLQIADPIWRASPSAQLSTVDVTSASWSSTTRSLVRRYSLGYQGNAHDTRTHLAIVTLEGECQGASGALTPIAEANNLVPNPSGCPAPSIQQLAQYTYYPDALSGFLPVTSILPSNTLPGQLVQDMDGDGAADLVSRTPEQTSFTIQPFSTASATSLSMPSPALDPRLTFESCYGLADGPHGEPRNTCVDYHPLTFGDWLANGAVNWLTYDGPISSTGAPPLQPWNVYSPVGTTFSATAINAGACAGSDYCDTGRALDVDGNGLTDMSILPNGGPSPTFLTQRTHGGGIAPFGFPTPPYNGWLSADVSKGSRAIADMDGDGLPDITYLTNVVVREGTSVFTRWILKTWVNRGDGGYGWYGIDPSGATPNEITSYSGFLSGSGNTGTESDNPNFLGNFARMADLDGDGFADNVYLQTVNGNDLLNVCFRGGAVLSEAGWTCISTTLPTLNCGANAVYDPARSLFDVADIDGSGIPHILVSRYVDGTIAPDGTTVKQPCFDSVVYQTAVAPGTSPSLGASPSSTHPGLLHTVTTLGGAQETINYQSVRSLPNVNGTIPVAAWVVTGITKTNGVPAQSSMVITAQSLTSTTAYTYQSPIYDPRDKAFVGFRTVQESQSGDVGAPGLVRTTNFLTSACGPLTGSSCTDQVDYGWVRALRGMIASVDEKDSNGTELKTTVNGYVEHNLYTGLDGRVVRKLPLAQKNEYLWDPAHQVSGGAAPSRPIANVGSTYYESIASIGAVSGAALPSNPAPTHAQQWDEDNLGNPQDAIDFGQSGVDAPIRTTYHWSLPAGDATGWSYRADSSSLGYTADASGATIASPPARSYTSTYDSLGRLSTKSALLTGEPAPMGAPSFAAGSPADASHNGPVCLEGCSPANPGIHYDAYGNVVQNGGPSGRCTGVTYDAQFSQLPRISTTYTAGCGSANPLQTVRVFDRGLEQVTQESLPSFPSVTPRITRKAYDPFGRIAEVDQPSAQFAGATDSSAAVTIRYNDSGPIRQIYFRSVDGPATGAATYQEHYRLIDGFGNLFAALDGATNTQTGTIWIGSSLQTRYSNGQVRQTFAPFPVFGSMSFPSSVLTLDADATDEPPATMTYDGARRVLTKTDFNGFQTTYSYQFGLPNAASAVTVRDPEQAGNGSHFGSFTQILSDGRGRAVQTDQHLNAIPDIDGDVLSGDVVTTTTYTATGERSAIAQTFPSGSYSRQMNYDTLGRMVSQSEPNVGTLQYAYDDAGDLVGTMDARGCGEVIYHDGNGRLVAEDYSPCDSNQAEYSAPNVTTGDGTEAFYAYDAYGNASSVSDRAQQSTFTYDPRGRVTKEQRRFAVPGGSDSLSTRYAPHVYTKGFVSYSKANRLLSSTTGTDLPDLAVNGSSQVTASYSSQGTIASVTSSYGALLTGRVTDSSGRMTQETFGDAAQTNASGFYDNDGSLVAYAIARSPGSRGGAWTTYAQSGVTTPAQNTYQTVLTSRAIVRDKVGNPIEIDQNDGIAFAPSGPGPWDDLPAAHPSEWPPGAAPVDTMNLSYSDDYRLTDSFTPVYAGQSSNGEGGPNSGDIFVSPYTPADGTLYPSPGPVSTGRRVENQALTYDWRGNLAVDRDDANVFFDRSIGQMDLAAADQIADAASIDPFGAPGTLTAANDAAGNLTSIDIQGGSSYVYSWDEVGRLAGASRTDADGAQVEESYTYDAQGQRVDTARTISAGPELHTIQVFDSLVVKNAAFPDAGGQDYEHDDATEQVYLRAGGQLLGHAFYAQSPMPSASGSQVHVFMPLKDPLGSTAFVIDHDTGELVEAATYQPYGAVESDYRPSRWGGFREDVRYTGHWDNAEVGLVYMNARYYSPQLHRFISPDPMTVQGASGDPNPYAYASGSPLKYTDPSGLYDQYSPCAFGGAECNDSYTPINLPGDSTAGAGSTSGDSSVGSSGGSGGSSGSGGSGGSGIIPVSFNQDFPPHAGAVIYDQSQTNWTEDFPSGSVWGSPSVVKFQSDVGNIVTGSNGLPTTSSLQSVISIVLQRQGRASSLDGLILPGLDVDAARRYAQGAQQNPPNYNFLSWGGENCATFVCNEITAAGGSGFNTILPSALVNQSRNDFSYTSFTYAPSSGVVYNESLPYTPNYAAGEF